MIRSIPTWEGAARAGVAALALFLTACGGGGSDNSNQSTYAPVFLTTPAATATAGVLYTYTPGVNLGAGATIEITPDAYLAPGATALPSGASFTAGVVTWTPASGLAGQRFNFHLTATNTLKGDKTQQNWYVDVSAAPSLSGTVASGEAVAGTVAVKGANGRVSTASIDAAGHYSADVSALTAPFLLYASGSAAGHSVALYSAAAAGGTVNITPITTLIVATALNATPGAAFAAWDGTQVSAAQLSTAQTQVRAGLGPVLAGAGVQTGTDLMSAPFSADHTGLDAALDCLDISYASGVATIVNKATGSQYTETLSTPASAQGLPAGDNTATASALTAMTAINSFWTTYSNLFASTVPTAQQVQAVGGPYYAPGFLDNGMTAAQAMADYPQVTGLTIKASLVRAIPAPQGFSSAYLTSVTYGLGNQVESHPMQIVLDGGTWKIYGNQQWIYTGLNAQAQMAVDPAGHATFQTGLQFELRDSAGYAHDRGVQSAVVTGPGLGAGVALAYSYPATQFHFADGGNLFWITDDGVIQGIPDLAEYTVGLYTQPATSVSASDTAVCSFTTPGSGAPLVSGDLDASQFPVLTTPASHSYSALGLPGSLPVAWTNPGNALMTVVELGVDSTQVINLFSSGSSSTLDGSGVGANPQSAWLWLDGKDRLGRGFALQWFFQ